MIHASHPPPAVQSPASTPMLMAFFAREPHPSARPARPARHRGQGLVEYALVLVMIAIGTIGILSILGRETSHVFTEVDCTMNGGEWRIDNGNGNSARCIGARPGNGGGNGGGRP